MKPHPASAPNPADAGEEKGANESERRLSPSKSLSRDSQYTEVSYTDFGVWPGSPARNDISMPPVPAFRASEMVDSMSAFEYCLPADFLKVSSWLPGVIFSWKRGAERAISCIKKG